VFVDSARLDSLQSDHINLIETTDSLLYISLCLADKKEGGSSRPLLSCAVQLVPTASITSKMNFAGFFSFFFGTSTV
jgi:hypothetical protein